MIKAVTDNVASYCATTATMHPDERYKRQHDDDVAAQINQRTFTAEFLFCTGCSRG